jgi:hypothetical protein
VTEDEINFIIETVRLPVRQAREDKKTPGVDLTSYRRQFRSLVADIELHHRLTLEDWTARTSPNKPKRKLEDNWDKHEPGLFDYGADTGAGLEDWDRFWMQHFHLSPGQTGASRSKPSLSLVPLSVVYVMLDEWWRRTLEKPFNPDYHGRHRGGSLKHIAYFNPAARLFLLVAQSIDHQYTATHCNSLQDRLRKLGLPRRIRKASRK